MLIAQKHMADVVRTLDNRHHIAQPFNRFRVDKAKLAPTYDLPDYVS